VPSDLTIFAAKYLVFIDALLAALLLLVVLYRRPRTEWIRWAIAICITLIVAFVLAKIGSALYSDPRPFSVDHVKPLIPHAADNGFPSDHALLAAAIVAAVLLVDVRLAVIFVVLGVLVDWARIGSGIHHVIDVLGSSVFVAIGLLIGWLVAPAVTRWLVRYVPERYLNEPAADRRTGIPATPRNTG
jgi:undecaprenyl-diphosphatase